MNSRMKIRDRSQTTRELQNVLPAGTCSLTYFGKFSFSFGLNASHTLFPQYLILDFRANDHMTPLPKYFSTYSSCPSNTKISTTDENLITTAGQGEVQISPSITLRSVLHVPKLSTNLISVQKLTKDLSCNVFHSNTCILQNKNLGRMIGHARKWNDLYNMEDRNQPINSHSLTSESTITNKEKTQLHHYRLGHPSFQFVKFIFSSLFKNKGGKSPLVRCEFTKHKSVNFFISNNRNIGLIGPLDYKAMLVAKGFTQTYGMHYMETFALVAKMNKVRVILSLVANHDLDPQQFDVK